MNAAVVLCLVLLATFGLLSLVLSALVALLGSLAARSERGASLDVLGLRLLPTVGALLVTLTVVLPAFLRYEPSGEREATGPLLWILAAVAAASLEHGIRRGVRACGAARALLGRCGPGRPQEASGSQPHVHYLRAAEPLVAVIGAWRPRLVASECVRAACSAEEFRAVLAHEAAHLAARDNLKLLLLLAAPDPLAWTPLAASLTERWRAAAEREADERATGADPQRRLALACALIKVARLHTSRRRSRPALGMPIATEDVSGRVRALLAPPAPQARSCILTLLAACAVVVPLLAMPRYALLHELIEQLVGLGR